MPSNNTFEIFNGDVHINKEGRKNVGLIVSGQ